MGTQIKNYPEALEGMQPTAGQTTTVVHVSPKNHTGAHTLIQQNGQHVLLSKLTSESIAGRPITTGAEGVTVQTTHASNTQTIYPAHYIEAIAEQTVYAANGDNSGILEIKSGTPLRKLFASVTKSLPGQYQEYTPIIYAPVSGGQTYYQTASGQVLATAFGSAASSAPGTGLHAAGHTNLGTGHAQFVTHQGATYLLQSGQLEDDASAISHTAKASPITVQWLVDNYETAEGVSLPRSTLYFHYLQHCNEHKLEPMNPASFGKLIRSVFYGLRTRRLGTRGNSKYHYYGIRIKPNSPLNHFVEDAGFSLRHYPNYHRQTMEAAAEWKNFTNSSVNRLKSSSLVSGVSNLSHLTSHQQSQHSATNSHGSSTQQSHNLSFNSTSARSDKPFSGATYGSNTGLSQCSNSTVDNANSANTVSSPVISSTSQHQHAQFLGEASSALPNLDEICRSSGLPVPSEVDLTSLTTETQNSGKNKNKTGSVSSDPSFCTDVITFCRLYALSAGYMLDAVVNLDFTAIETIWRAFWCTEEVHDSRLKQSLPQERLYALVSDSAVLQFVRLYDHTFYQSLAEVLIPNVLRPIPPTLTQAIRNFAKSLEGWMRQATQGLDSTLINLKVSAVSALAQTLRRYTSLNHLAQAARAVLKNANQINQMLADLNRVDFNNVQEQASWVCQCSDATVSQLEQDFKQILHKHASLEEWAQWLDTVVTGILQPLEGNSLAYTRAAHQLILKWSFYSSMVIRDLTLRSAASFGSFHLIRLLYDEYIFYLVEHKVAAHLGMTPVAVMGEMGRDMNQQHYAQSRLHLDLSVRRDIKSLGSNLNDEFDSANYPEEEGSSLRGANFLSVQPSERNRDVSRPDENVEEDDEEVDEYLDDEEDVDDSVGDEGAMLKEAHASVQAYCRITNSVTKGCEDSISKVDDDTDSALESVQIVAVHEEVAQEKSDLDINQNKVDQDSVSNESSLIQTSELTDTQSKATDQPAIETQIMEGSGSPPSIVTVPSSVRKVVRVTTFCDARQHSIDSPSLSTGTPARPSNKTGTFDASGSPENPISVNAVTTSITAAKTTVSDSSLPKKARLS